MDIDRHHINECSSLSQINDQNILTKESSMSKHQSASSRIEQTEPVDFSSTPSIFGDISGIPFGRVNSPRHLDRLRNTGNQSFNLSSF